MLKKRNLNDISVGEFAYIKGIHTDAEMKRRLLDIGLIENTRVECVLKSPCNDPAAYLIRGAVIALRSEDSEKIEIYLKGEI